MKKYYFVSCVALIVLLSLIRSGPVYGKLDFISLEARPWWPQWKSMVVEQIKMERKKIFSDPQTIAILSGVFNLPSYNNTAYLYNRDFDRNPASIIHIDGIAEYTKAHDYRCIINLRGFRSSWVPEDTGHWKEGLGNTSLYYELDGFTGDDLKEYLKKHPPQNCKVYF